VREHFSTRATFTVAKHYASKVICILDKPKKGLKEKVIFSPAGFHNKQINEL